MIAFCVEALSYKIGTDCGLNAQVEMARPSANGSQIVAYGRHRREKFQQKYWLEGRASFLAVSLAGHNVWVIFQVLS